MDKYEVPLKEFTQRMKRISNVVVKWDEVKQQNVVYFPGLSLTSFSRAGVPTAFSIARMLEEGNRPLLKYDYSDKGVVHVGKSSGSVEKSITDADSGDILISARSSFVMRSISTGRSERVPEDIRQKLTENRNKGKNTKVEIMKDFPEKPSTCFKQTIHVRHSDTDSLYHSNQASYFKYCMDAATEGARLGHFRLLKGDLLSYRIELMECLYMGESFVGDDIIVSVWENLHNAFELFCEIEKQGKVIWIGKISFRFEIGSQL